MNTIQALIRNKNGIVFEGNVFAVSSTNDVGPFDILPGHANFICIIKNKLIIHHSKIKKEEMDVDSGILRVKDNKIEIYLGI